MQYVMYLLFVNRPRQMYKNISMLFLFPVKINLLLSSLVVV